MCSRPGDTGKVSTSSRRGVMTGALGTSSLKATFQEMKDSWQGEGTGETAYVLRKGMGRT